MRVNELRNKGEDELKTMVLERKKELMNLRFRRAENQEGFSPARIRAARREIARIKTVLHEKR